MNVLPAVLFSHGYCCVYENPEVLSEARREEGGGAFSAHEGGGRVRVSRRWLVCLLHGDREFRMGVYGEKEGLTRHNKYIKLFMIQSSTGLDGHFSTCFENDTNFYKRQILRTAALSIGMTISNCSFFHSHLN